MVQFDDSSEPVQMSSQSLKQVSPTIALSPGARAVLGAHGDDKADSESATDEGSGSSTSSSSDGEHGGSVSSPNKHVARSKEFDDKYSILVGSTITVHTAIGCHSRELISYRAFFRL